MKSKLPRLSRLKDTSRGSIDHMSIRPAKNGKGKPAFITKVHRNPSPAAAAAMANGGPYAPMPAPEEAVHDNAQAMLQHVGKTFAIPPDQEPDENDPNEAQEGE